MEQQPQSRSEIVLYQTEDGSTRIEVKLANDTAWLSLNQIAELFQRDKSVISKHIKNVFEEGELHHRAVVANFATTATDGKTYQVSYYNLNLIIAVGYRVKSQRGTQFRQWATQRLSEYLVKGLTEAEITELNRVVSTFLDYAEDQAYRRKQVFMRDWREKLDGFLKFNERNVLDDKGVVARVQADRHAEEQFALFETRRRQELEAKGEIELSDALQNLEDQSKQIAKSKRKARK